MKKTLNKFLKFLGFNVVRAKRPRARKITPEKLDALNASARLRNEKNKEITSKYFENRPPYTESELMACGKTHYVGDDCPGGHKYLPDCFRDHVAVGYQAGTLPAQPDNTAVGTCNTVIGPEAKNFVAECAKKVEDFSKPFITGPTS